MTRRGPRGQLWVLLLRHRLGVFCLFVLFFIKARASHWRGTQQVDEAGWSAGSGAGIVRMSHCARLHPEIEPELSTVLAELSP